MADRTTAYLDRQPTEAVPAMSSKPRLVVIFEGCLYGNRTPWGGPAATPDGPVPGSRRFAGEAVTMFEVHVWSALRSPSPEGRAALERWCRLHYGEIADELHYPERQPPALVAIGPRFVRFMGSFPPSLALLNFTPWKPGT
jgi:hypothetical protein